MLARGNRTQALVLAFLLLAWISLVAILVVAPEIYDQTLELPLVSRRLTELLFLAAISALIALLAVGVSKRWRWTFWLILVAFLFGVLRVPASILELVGVLPMNGPTWYVVFQAVLGLLQFGIGLLMLAGFRRAGVWGAV
jgi:hypothetical protein